MRAALCVVCLWHSPYNNCLSQSHLCKPSRVRECPDCWQLHNIEKAGAPGLHCLSDMQAAEAAAPLQSTSAAAAAFAPQQPQKKRPNRLLSFISGKRRPLDEDDDEDQGPPAYALLSDNVLDMSFGQRR